MYRNDGRVERIFVIDGIIFRKTSSMPIDGPLMAIDGPHGTAMAIDELRWDLSTGYTVLSFMKIVRTNFENFVIFFERSAEKIDCINRRNIFPTLNNFFYSYGHKID